MEHHLRPVAGEDTVQGLRIPDVAEHHVRRVEEGVAVEVELCAVEAGLVAVQEDQLARAEVVHLPGDLRSDGATGPGDEHHLALEIPGDLLEVRSHLATAEEVLDVHLAHLAELHLALDDLGDRGKGE